MGGSGGEAVVEGNVGSYWEGVRWGLKEVD